MTELEERILAMLLQGDSAVLAVLRAQHGACKVADRDFTGIGCFSNFDVPADVARLGIVSDFRIGDVYAEITGLKSTAGFILLIRSGVIDSLECFTQGESWPDDARLVRAYYVRPATAGSGSLVESPTRDLTWALGSIAA
jgi:hypothetical protein